MRDRPSPLYFYELHEGDGDVYADLLLAHEAEFDEAEFLALVLEARERVIDGFTTDTLIEAVAADLAEHAGFLVIDDHQLRAAVNVSAEAGGTFSADVSEGPLDGGDGEGAAYRSLLVDLDREDRRWGDGQP
jgi:hypothetical protein